MLLIECTAPCIHSLKDGSGMVVFSRMPPSLGGSTIGPVTFVFSSLSTKSGDRNGRSMLYGCFPCWCLLFYEVCAEGRQTRWRRQVKKGARVGDRWCLCCMVGPPCLSEGSRVSMSFGDNNYRLQCWCTRGWLRGLCDLGISG